MRSISSIHFALLFVLTILCGCKKQTRQIATIQTLNTSNQSSYKLPACDESLYNINFKEPVFPKTFVISKDKKGRLNYTQIGDSLKGSCSYFAFTKYDVMTTTTQDNLSERIDVFKHISVSSDTLILTEADSIIFTVGKENSRFDKLIGEFLVISFSSAPSSACSWIYNVVTRRRTCAILYSDRNCYWDSLKLNCWVSIDSVATIENCPECKEWLARGNEAGFEEKVIIDIRSGEKIRLGKFRCVSIM